MSTETQQTPPTFQELIEAVVIELDKANDAHADTLNKLKEIEQHQLSLVTLLKEQQKTRVHAQDRLEDLRRVYSISQAQEIFKKLDIENHLGEIYDKGYIVENPFVNVWHLGSVKSQLEYTIQTLFTYKKDYPVVKYAPGNVITSSGMSCEWIRDARYEKRLRILDLKNGQYEIKFSDWILRD